MSAVFQHFPALSMHTALDTVARGVLGRAKDKELIGVFASEVPMMTLVLRDLAANGQEDRLETAHQLSAAGDGAPWEMA